MKHRTKSGLRKRNKKAFVLHSLKSKYPKFDKLVKIIHHSRLGKVDIEDLGASPKKTIDL